MNIKDQNQTKDNLHKKKMKNFSILFRVLVVLEFLELLVVTF